MSDKTVSKTMDIGEYEYLTATLHRGHATLTYKHPGKTEVMRMSPWELSELANMLMDMLDEYDGHLEEE